MDFDKKKIIEKIKKCFALSTSANPHEAAIALGQAHALARKYNIENIDSLQNNISVGEKLHASNQLSVPTYLVRLINLINRIFNTKTVIHPTRITEKKNKSSIEFFGLACDIAISEYAWTVLSRLLIKARTDFLEKCIDKRMNRSTKSSRADLYALGWVQSVEKLVVNLGYNLSEEELQKHVAQIELLMNTVHPDLTSGKELKKFNNYLSANEIDAFLKGRDDGKLVSLGKGLEPREQELIELGSKIS